jgi:hypothetical protein
VTGDFLWKELISAFYLLKKKNRESFLLASQKSTGLEDGGDGGEGLNDQSQTQNRVCAIL